MIATDLILDANYDDRADETGDFDFGPSDQETIELIIITSPGEWRRSPATGLGINKYINAPYNPLQKRSLHRNLKLQLEADGFTDIKIINNSDNTIEVDAQRPD